MRGGGMQIITSLERDEKKLRGELNQAMFPKERTLKLKSHWKEMLQADKYKWEAICRLGISYLAAFIMSIATIPSVVPPSYQYLVAILVLCFCSLPRVLFTIIGAFPTVFVATILILGFATMVLAAASVSDGVLMLVFSLYAYWTVSVYFGEKYNKTWSMGQNLLGVVALLALGVRPLLAQVPQDQRLQLVNELWKQQGTENPLAVMRNILITVCWAVLIVMVSILLPPYRTARSSIAMELLPVLLKQTVAVINGKLDKDSLVVSSDVLKQGQIAGMALFEPPPLGSQHGFLVAELGALVAGTDKVILVAIAVKTAIQENYFPTEYMRTDEGDDDGACELATSALLMDIATALGSKATSSIATLEKHGVVEDADERFGDNPFFPLYEEAVALRRVALTWLHAFHPLYNDNVATQPPFKDRLSTFVKTKLKIWIAAPFVGVPLTMAVALLEPLRPKTWNLRHFLWKFKRTAGAVALFAMSIYWEEYANFAINRDDWRLGAVYYGWDMLGYCNSWRPSMEGTFKKGLQRLLGAAFGGFLAWLGCIICSASYSDDASINPYGLTAYLTIISTAVTFLMFKKGLSARFGVVFDTFYFWMYVIVNTALLSIEVFLGLGSRDGLVVNRIVATATGVAVAWLIAAVPPFERGGSTKHSFECLLVLKDSFVSLLRTFECEDDWNALDPVVATTMFVHDAQEKRDYAEFLRDDASLYDTILGLYAPNLTVHAGLKPLLADVQVTITLLGMLIEILAISKDVEKEKVRRVVSEMLEVGLDKAFDEESETTPSITDISGRALLLVRVISDRLEKHKRALDAIDSSTNNVLLAERVSALERERIEISRELAKLRAEAEERHKRHHQPHHSLSHAKDRPENESNTIHDDEDRCRQAGRTSADTSST